MRQRAGIVRCLAGGAAMSAMAAVAVSGAQHAARTSHPRRAATLSVFPMLRVPTMRPASTPSGGYTPAQIRAAYFLNPLLHKGVNGTGESVVIVDSFGSPTIRGDLKVFDRQFKLSPPRSLTIIHPAGPIPPFKPTQTRIGWAEETTLDVEWAHVMAPRARIVLVETPVSENEGRSGFPQIVKAEKYVLAHKLGGVISQSFGATEETFPKGSVRAVGGLNLRLDRRGHRNAPDEVWNDPGYPSAGGGGKSVIFGRPDYQNPDASIVGRHRGVPDISMSASCSHPVTIYQSFSGRGWQNICGTSEATPLFAGVIALADQVARRWLGPINSDLYKLAATRGSGIPDITRGNNTVSFRQSGKSYTVQGWNAVHGYDLSSGLGTINASVFVRKLAAMAK